MAAAIATVALPVFIPDEAPLPVVKDFRYVGFSFVPGQDFTCERPGIGVYNPNVMDRLSLYERCSLYAKWDIQAEEDARVFAILETIGNGEVLLDTGTVKLTAVARG